MTTTAKTGIRCPHCGRKVAQNFLGEIWIRCSKCKADLHLIFDKGRLKNLN